MTRPFASSLRKIRPVLWPAWLLLAGGQFLAAGEPGAIQGLACPQSFGFRLERNCVFADLDGDGKPDVAFSGDLSGRSGTRVVISIRLSGSSREETFSFESSSPASGIRVRDLDGDHDLDLILTRGFRQPVTVLLNDGKGSFTLDPNGQYLLADDDDDANSGLTESFRLEELLAAETVRTTPLAALIRAAQEERLACRSLRIPLKPIRRSSARPWNSALIRAP